jgi:hypothetical protein
MKRLVLLLTISALLLGDYGHARAGAIFLTGHDPDFHAVQGGNQAGAQAITQRAISFVTGGMANPNILLITDLTNPGGVTAIRGSGLPPPVLHTPWRITVQAPRGC